MEEGANMSYTLPNQQNWFLSSGKEIRWSGIFIQYCNLLTVGAWNSQAKNGGGHLQGKIGITHIHTNHRITKNGGGRLHGDGHLLGRVQVLIES